MKNCRKLGSKTIKKIKSYEEVTKILTTTKKMNKK